jgi:hypothetical protein
MVRLFDESAALGALVALKPLKRVAALANFVFPQRRRNYQRSDYQHDRTVPERHSKKPFIGACLIIGKCLCWHQPHFTMPGLVTASDLTEYDDRLDSFALASHDRLDPPIRLYCKTAACKPYEVPSRSLPKLVVNMADSHIVVQAVDDEQCCIQRSSESSFISSLVWIRRRINAHT